MPSRGPRNTLAALVPFVPAGASKAVRTANNLSDASKITKTEKVAKKVSETKQTAEAISKESKKNIGKYADAHVPKNAGSGKPFTRKTKEDILSMNKNQNNGSLTSDISGIKGTPSLKNTKGISPSPNSMQIDHIIPKSKGGSNHPSNAQVITRSENIIKSNKHE